MRKLVFALTFSLSLCTVALGQHTGHNNKKKAAEKAPTYVAGLGSHRHPVSTTNAAAQKFFDQGLTFVYAFNHDEAIRSFKRAAELDPKLAMAHWGVALALGPNINLDVDAEREQAASEAVQKALSLAAQAPENERAYIEALATRYSIAPNADLKKLAVDYKNAMGNLVRRYPDDLDAATLYAESAMNLRPWKFWTPDGKPAEGTEEIVAVLESVLRRNPNHPGANHYYIHAVEASLTPERALPSARRLTTLVPAAGHLVHMPAHVFIRTGDYLRASNSNEMAARVDEEFFRKHPSQGMYPLGYYTHNLHFLAISRSMEGRLADARRAARRLESYMHSDLHDMFMMEMMSPMTEMLMPTPMLVLVRFHRWREVLALRQPDQSLKVTTGLWHFSRGMAFASGGDTAKAENELQSLQKIQKSVPAEAMINLNNAGAVLSVAENFLRARIAEANKQNGAAVEFLTAAAKIEDGLAYDEPPAWYIPSREALGGLLLRSGQWADAEKAFQADLQINKLSGRSLFGLAAALKAQKKSREALRVQRQFQVAWKNADTRLTIDSL